MSGTALATTALLMGLAGSPHCAAMCGAVCTAITGSTRKSGVVAAGSAGTGVNGLAAADGVIRLVPVPMAASALSLRVAALLAGRLVSYAGLGALVAASVGVLASAGSSTAPLRPFWAMLHVAAIALGLWLLATGRQPGWMQDLARRIGRWVGASDDTPTRASLHRVAGAGLMWGAWPCGLLQSALVVAALGSSAAEGATVMAAFAVGSSIGLLVGPALWTGLGRAGRLGSPQALTRLAGGLLAAASAFALWHLAMAAFDPLVCRA
jgi:hypothetical protein